MYRAYKSWIFLVEIKLLTIPVLPRAAEGKDLSVGVGKDPPEGSGGKVPPIGEQPEQ